MSGVGGLGLLEQIGLIGFDLEQVITALLDDHAGIFALAMQGVGSDKFFVEGAEGLEQGGGAGEFAGLGAVFLIVEGNGLWSAVLVFGQGE